MIPVAIRGIATAMVREVKKEATVDQDEIKRTISQLKAKAEQALAQYRHGDAARLVSLILILSSRIKHVQ